MPLPNSRLLHPRFHREVQRSAVGDAGMPDEGTITRPATGDGAIVAGVWTPPVPTLVYTGEMRVQPEPSTANRTVVVGDKVVTLHRYRVGLPASAAPVLVDDVVEVTGSEDAHLVGQPLVVRDVTFDSFLTRRFLLCEDHLDDVTEEAP